MNGHLRSLSLVLAGALLGGLAASSVPGARAQDASSGLPADLQGSDVAILTAEGRNEVKILGVVQVGGATFLKLDYAAPLPDRYMNVDQILQILPK